MSVNWRDHHMKSNKSMVIFGLLILATSMVTVPTFADNPKCEAIDGDYIVSFSKESNSKAEMKNAPGKAIKSKFEFENVLNGFAASLSAEQVCAFHKRPNIESIELDSIATTQGAINQSIAGSGIWGLDRIDERSLAMDSVYASSSDGTGSTIYIVDTGVNNIVGEFGVRYSIKGFTNVSGAVSFADENGHGTHVAATSAGTTYGVAKGATVVSVRVLDSNGSGSWSAVAQGLDWIASRANTNSKAASIINMSLGGSKNRAIDIAVGNIIKAGFTVVVAAGNERKDACTFSPANVPTAITVGASDINDVFASFSNRGSCVDITAPGVSIKSIWLDAPGLASGTSMASPHVAGVAALYRANYPSANPAAVWTALSNAASTGKITKLPIKTANKLLCIVGCSKE